MTRAILNLSGLDDTAVQSELAAIVSAARSDEDSEDVAWASLFQGSNRRRMIVGVGVMCTTFWLTIFRISFLGTFFFVF